METLHKPPSGNLIASTALPAQRFTLLFPEIMGIAKASEATQKSPGVPKIAAVAGPAYDTPKGKVQVSHLDVVARLTALQ